MRICYIHNLYIHTNAHTHTHVHIVRRLTKTVSKVIYIFSRRKKAFSIIRVLRVNFLIFRTFSDLFIDHLIPYEKEKKTQKK